MMIIPQLLAPPARYPLSIDEAKSQLNIIETPDWDARIAGLIAAATSYVENYTGRALITRGYKGFLDHWPRLAEVSGMAQDYGAPGPWPEPSAWLTRRWVEIPRPPLQAISAVTTFDDDDNATVWDVSSYYVDTSSTVGRLVRRRDACWPPVCRAANGIEIQWTSGYGDSPGDTPEPIRHAMLLLISHWFENREAVVGVEGRDSSTPLPLGVPDLLGPYKVAYFD